MASTASIMDYALHLSRRARALPKNAFVDLIPMMKDPSCKILCQGVPPDTTFPLRSISVGLADGTEVKLGAEDAVLAQRYAPFAWGPLREWILEHMKALHSPPVPEWDVAMAAGSMSSVELCSAMFLDPGDIILIEEYSFTASLDCFRTYGVRLVPVALDGDGVQPESLLAACEALTAEGSGAKFLYMVPIGQNPTGTSLAPQRYAEIYEIARKFNFLIVEDDAYFYQQHSPRVGAEGAHSPSSEMPLPGLRLGPSFLSIDTDGRVLRLDSFSKWLAPGFRLGWVTGARPLIEKYNGLAYVSSQNGCSLSMMIIGRMLKAWGEQGLEEHLVALQRSLRERCRALLKAAEEHMGNKSGAATIFHRPQAGMFLWVRLPRKPADRGELVTLMREHGIAVLPGHACSSSLEGGECPYVRLTFVLGEEHYSEAMQRFNLLTQALL